MEKHTTIESILPGSGQYAWRKDFRLNYWIVIAAFTYVGCVTLLKEHPEWSTSWRVVVALVPLVPTLFYLRVWTKFLSQLDEMQKRLQLEVWLFAALGTVVINAIAGVLAANGVLGQNFVGGLGVGGSYLTIFFLWTLGSYRMTRRFR